MRHSQPAEEMLSRGLQMLATGVATAEDLPTTYTPKASPGACNITSVEITLTTGVDFKLAFAPIGPGLLETYSPYKVTPTDRKQGSEWRWAITRLLRRSPSARMQRLLLAICWQEGAERSLLTRGRAWESTFVPDAIGSEHAKERRAIKTTLPDSAVFSTYKALADGSIPFHGQRGCERNA